MKLGVASNEIRELLFRREYDKLVAVIQRQCPHLDAANQLDAALVKRFISGCRDFADLLTAVNYDSVADLASSLASDGLDLITTRNTLEPATNDLIPPPGTFTGRLLWDLVIRLRFCQSRNYRETQPNANLSERDMAQQIATIVKQLESSFQHLLTPPKRKGSKRGRYVRKRQKPSAELLFAFDLQTKY